MSKRELIGRVGVDSGQLMIMDPAYMKTAHNMPAELVGIRFWGQGQDGVAKQLKNFYEVDDDQPGHAYFVSGDEGVVEDVEKIIKQYMKETGETVVSSRFTTGFYDQVISNTLSSKQAGSIPFPLGHEGLAVAFTSGFGDGVYDVYATFEDYKDWGKRVRKVEIILIDDEEGSE